MNDLDILRRYDAAPASMYDDVAAERAKARFEQIVATAPERVPERVAVPRHLPALRALRLAAVGALVIGAVVASIVLPGGRGASSAFASWTAAPAVVPQSALDAIDRACREGFAQTVADLDVPLRDRVAATLGTPTLLVAEQRGDFGVAAYTGDGRTVALFGEQSASAFCFTYGEAGSPSVAQLSIDVTGWSGFTRVTSMPEPPPPFRIAWSVGGASPAEVAADEVVLVNAAGGTMDGEGPFTILDGAVGDDVTDVVIHADGRDIEATVRGGYLLAWWPGGTEARWRTANLSDVFGVTVTLRDGTVHQNVRPMGF